MQLLSGDLDWVVMKALEKDRNRRYDDARAASPRTSSVTCAMRRSWPGRRRRPTGSGSSPSGTGCAVLTAAVVAVALLAGIAVSTWQALRATRAESGALVAAAAEKAAKDDALAREAETKAVLGFVENRVFAAARPEGQSGGLGREVTLRKAIESALPYVEQELSQPAAD